MTVPTPVDALNASTLADKQDAALPQPLRWLLAHRYPLLAGGAILAAVVIRATLAAAGWPGTDSDDATMGLMAKHILSRGELPIFFWGQSYMGTIEAYLGALMFAALGVSEFALKCGLIALYAGFMGVMYLLLARLYNRVWALIGLALLALGSDAMLYHQLNAYGGYLETIFFGALMILLASWLAHGAGPLRRRRWGFFGWGLAAGLGIWSDPLVLPFVALSALLILVMRWRELRSRLALLAILGLLVGVSPWIVYLATAPSLDVAKSFLQHGNLPTRVMSTTGAQPATRAAGPSPLAELRDQALGVIVIAIPDDTGVAALCPLPIGKAWPPQSWTGAMAGACVATRAVWGSVFLALLAVALAIEAHAFWLLRRRSRAWSDDERREAARRGGRLVALGAPALTIVLFAASSSAATAPAIYSRYLIGVLIAMPALLASLWRASVALGERWRPRIGLSPRIAVACLTGGLALALLAGVVGAWGDVPAIKQQNARQMALVRLLERQGDTRFYSDFWTCERAIFQSDERLVCSVLNTDLSARPNRYPGYDALVRAAPHPPYVFPVDSTQAQLFPVWAAMSGWRYDTTIFDGSFVIYRLLPAGG